MELASLANWGQRYKKKRNIHLISSLYFHEIVYLITVFFQNPFYFAYPVLIDLHFLCIRLEAHHYVFHFFYDTRSISDILSLCKKHQILLRYILSLAKNRKFMVTIEM